MSSTDTTIHNPRTATLRNVPKNLAPVIKQLVHIHRQQSADAQRAAEHGKPERARAFIVTITAEKMELYDSFGSGVVFQNLTQ